MESADNKRGSALAAALIIAASVGLVAGSAARVSNVERKLNQDAELMIEARNAAEAVVEFGFADLSKRFDSNSAFATDALAPKAGSTPLRLPTAFYDLFSQRWQTAATNVVLPPKPYDPMVKWGTYDTEIIGGVVPPGEWKFIDSRTPGNEFDPLRDMNVFVRAVKVYGRATVQGNQGDKKTAYCSQELQVRDGPLFAYAIFYNMDMEIAPGPDMDVRGAVHANGNMYIQANSSLDFFRQVSAVGDIFHGTFPGIVKAAAGGSVTFADGDDVQLSMNTGGSWLDSTNKNWRSLAANRWDGNVQDASMGIQRHNPVSLPPYQRDDPATATLDDALNYGYQLVRTLDSTGATDAGIERQKFAYNAGLIVSVQVASGRISGFTLKTPVRDSDGNLVYTGTLPKTVPLSAPSGVITIDNYISTSGTKDSSVVNGGLYDARRAEYVDILEIDMNAFRQAVHANNPADWGGSGKEPSSWWNGTVYVEFPEDTSDPIGKDGIRRSVDGFGLKLKNAQRSSTVPGIPDPANPKVMAFSAPRGTTIATNNVLYIEGNYNADGKSTTGGPTDPDDDYEPPAALAADAINVLSESWNDAYSARPSMSKRAATIFTEVSAAFLTGLAPSDKRNNNAYSGGVENFPRFLEDWSTSGQTIFRYRGSMVALFESEIAADAWGASNVYDPPGRNWGFHKLFSEGLYPPGTPNTRTYRRINFRNLTKAEWEAQITKLKSQLGI